MVNETKAYASAPVENKIVIFNPTTMERTGEIDLVDTKWGVDGSNTPNPIGLFLRDDILYVGLGQFENMPICKKGAHILLVDTKTDKPIKKIVDYRLSSATVTVLVECLLMKRTIYTFLVGDPMAMYQINIAGYYA